MSTVPLGPFTTWMSTHWALPRGHLRAHYPSANIGQSFYSSGVLIERPLRHRSAPNRPSAVSLRLVRFLLGAQSSTGPSRARSSPNIGAPLLHS
jgi:hypothetical protein